MTHLTPEELIDAVEHTLRPERGQHAETCAQCRQQVHELASLLREVEAVDVPEPSPLFWERLSHRVRDDIRAAPEPRLTRWFQWPVLAPLGALAMLVVALVSAVPETERRATEPLTSAPVAAELTTADRDMESQWELLAALVGDLDVESAQEAGLFTPPGTADRTIPQLSDAEQEELLRLLREELQQSGG